MSFVAKFQSLAITMDTLNNMFRKNKTAQQIARIEFRYFKQKAKNEIEIITQMPRFKEVEKYYSVHCDYDRQWAIQISFGHIPIGWVEIDDKIASEKGGCLVYSMGLDGRVVTIMYPAKSDFQKPFEDNIILRYGYFSGWQLRNFLRHDIKDMVSYTIATTTFGEATFRENLRIWWLRRTCPLTIEGTYHKPSMFTYAGKAAEFTLRQMLLALFKPFAFILVMGVLAYFGLPELIAFLSGAK